AYAGTAGRGAAGTSLRVAHRRPGNRGAAGAHDRRGALARRDHVMADHAHCRRTARSVLRHRDLLRLPGDRERPAEPACVLSPGQCGRRGDHAGGHRPGRRRRVNGAAAKADRELRLAVVGAGPAGMAAAVAAADAGIAVTVVDSGSSVGGQFYRQPAARLRARTPQRLHHGWRTWRALKSRFDQQVSAGRIQHLADHHAWFAERIGDEYRVHALIGPEQQPSVIVEADTLLLATGAYERVLPFPGWTLPGVVTAGGAQAMLKGSLVLPGREVVVAGTGPLLLPVAVALADAGAEVKALIESADRRSV